MLKVHSKNLGTAVILCLEGQIVTGETESLRNFAASLSEKSALILDLAGVSIIDAHGLGVMLELRAQAHEKRMSFELMNVSKPMSRVLEITRLDTVFKITPRLEFFPPVPRYMGARAA